MVQPSRIVSAYLYLLAMTLDDIGLRRQMGAPVSPEGLEAAKRSQGVRAKSGEQYC